jgi:hypothetical protein
MFLAQPHAQLFNPSSFLERLAKTNASFNIAPPLTEVDVIEGMPEGVVPSKAPRKVHAPKHHRHQAMNVLGGVKAVKVKELKNKTMQVEVTFSSTHVMDFANTPLTTGNEEILLSRAEGFVADHLKDYRFVLGFSGTFFRVSVKPTHIKRLNADTLRVTLSPTPSQRDRLRYFESEMSSHKGSDVPFILFADYGAAPHSHEAKTPFSKRYTYFVDALKGVTLTQETVHGKTTHTVTLKDVVEAISVSSKGNEALISGEKLASLIGTGKHPFKPNGSFVVLKDGTPKQCSFAFDKAEYDPKTHDMTFTVGLLTDETSSKPETSACFDGESMSYDEKLTLFLDSGSGGM